jgi:hypothetical protein
LITRAYSHGQKIVQLYLQALDVEKIHANSQSFSFHPTPKQINHNASGFLGLFQRSDSSGPNQLGVNQSWARPLQHAVALHRVLAAQDVLDDPKKLRRYESKMVG